MSKKAHETALPKLRFPEFQGKEAWKEIALRNVLTESRISSQLNDPRKRITVRLNLNGVEKREFRGTESDEATYFFTRKKGQFIYGKQNLHKGAFGIIPDELDNHDSSQDLPSFDFAADFDPQFFLNYLGQERLYTSLELISTGTGSKRISPKDFLKVKLFFPTLPEQKKIAAALSSLDYLLTAQTAKLTALQAHKRGLMQDLFPAEGETVPKRRFPEFQDAGEWEGTVLGEVAYYENGKAHEQHIVDNGKFAVVNSKFVSTEGAVRKFTDNAFCLAKKGDILMVLSDLPKGRALAKCFFVDADSKYTVNQRVARLSTKGVVSTILFYLLNRNAYFLALDDGITQTHIRKDEVLDCPLLLPKQKKEQQKIADCLSSIDTLITAQTQKIETLKLHKKGLMQALFPAASEPAT